jgi:hypothetical protein
LHCIYIVWAWVLFQQEQPKTAKGIWLSADHFAAQSSCLGARIGSTRDFQERPEKVPFSQMPGHLPMT